MNTWEIITGIIVLLLGIALFWQSYNTSVSCNSVGGQIVTAITSIFGGNQAQTCYNAVIIEVGSFIAAILGIAIIYAGVKNKPKRGK